MDLELRRREIASYTPYIKKGQHGGLLLSNVSEDISRQSVIELTGSDEEFDGLKRFYGLAGVFAEQVWDTMLKPLEQRKISVVASSEAIPGVRHGVAS